MNSSTEESWQIASVRELCWRELTVPIVRLTLAQRMGQGLHQSDKNRQANFSLEGCTNPLYLAFLLYIIKALSGPSLWDSLFHTNTLHGGGEGLGAEPSSSSGGERLLAFERVSTGITMGQPIHTIIFFFFPTVKQEKVAGHLTFCNKGNVS